MTDVLVRDLEPAVVEALKRRAGMQGRSLQVELKLILEQAARGNMVDARATAERIRKSLSKSNHSDSASLLSEDRER